jgi:hypothetical protein
MPKGKGLSVDMRKLIIDKFQSGEPQSDIAQQLNPSVISKTISLYNQRRSLVNVPESGRLRKTARITERKIGMLSRQNPFWDAVKIKKEIPNVRLSVRSIRRRHNEIGKSPVTVCKRAFELDAAPMEKPPIL